MRKLFTTLVLVLVLSGCHKASKIDIFNLGNINSDGNTPAPAVVGSIEPVGRDDGPVDPITPPPVDPVPPPSPVSTDRDSDGEEILASDSIFVIDKCGIPKGGWKQGTYVLEQNIQADEGTNICLPIKKNGLNITLNCKDHEIIGPTISEDPKKLKGVGILLEKSPNKVIKNCYIHHFENGIISDQTGQVSFTKNKLKQNKNGFHVRNGSTLNSFFDNQFCENHANDFICSNSNLFSGRRNFSDKLNLELCPTFPQNNFSRLCQFAVLENAGEGQNNVDRPLAGNGNVRVGPTPIERPELERSVMGRIHDFLGRFGNLFGRNGQNDNPFRVPPPPSDAIVDVENGADTSLQMNPAPEEPGTQPEVNPAPEAPEPQPEPSYESSEYFNRLKVSIATTQDWEDKTTNAAGPFYLDCFATNDGESFEKPVHPFYSFELRQTILRKENLRGAKKYDYNIDLTGKPRALKHCQFLRLRNMSPTGEDPLMISAFSVQFLDRHYKSHRSNVLNNQSVSYFNIVMNSMSFEEIAQFFATPEAASCGLTSFESRNVLIGHYQNIDSRMKMNTCLRNNLTDAQKESLLTKQNENYQFEGRVDNNEIYSEKVLSSYTLPHKFAWLTLYSGLYAIFPREPLDQFLLMRSHNPLFPAKLKVSFVTSNAGGAGTDSWVNFSISGEENSRGLYDDTFTWNDLHYENSFNNGAEDMNPFEAGQRDAFPLCTKDVSHSDVDLCNDSLPFIQEGLLNVAYPNNFQNFHLQMKPRGNYSEWQIDDFWVEMFLPEINKWVIIYRDFFDSTDFPSNEIQTYKPKYLIGFYND